MKLGKRKRNAMRQVCTFAKLPECIVQLIWEYLPMYDGILFSTVNHDTHRALLKELHSIRMLRRIAKLDGICIEKQIRQVRSSRAVNMLSFRVAAVPHERIKLRMVCDAMQFILQTSAAQHVEFTDGICASAVRRMLNSVRQHSFESLRLTNAMGYFTCSRHARASMIELGGIKTKKIVVEETYIAHETLSCLLLAISRIQKLKTVHMYKTWIQPDQSVHLARAIRRCSDICMSKCGLTSEHILKLSRVLETSSVRKLDLSFNAFDCSGVNELLSVLSRAKNSALRTLELEATFDFLDDDENWNCAIFDTFCKSQQNLEILNLSSNFLDDDFICDNKKALKRLKNLRTLQIAHNFITDYGVYKLSRFENKVTHVDLNENPINSISVTHFAGRLFDHVEELNLSGTKLFNDSLITFRKCAQMGVAFTNIHRLSMDDCDFSDAQIFLIFDLILTMKELSVLGLEENRFTEYSYFYFCEQLGKVTDKEVCILMEDNPIEQTTSEVPMPHCIVTS
jgi:hypothetical protein